MEMQNNCCYNAGVKKLDSVHKPASQHLIKKRLAVCRKTMQLNAYGWDDVNRLPSRITHVLKGGYMNEQSNEKRDREIEIVVNGRRKHVQAMEHITFDEVVRLAYENPPTGPMVIFTVTYKRGHGQKPEGSLQPGQSVRVKEGMIFNVTATDKS